MIGPEDAVLFGPCKTGNTWATLEANLAEASRTTPTDAPEAVQYHGSTLPNDCRFECCNFMMPYLNIIA